MQHIRLTGLLIGLFYVSFLTAQPTWIRDSLDFYVNRSMQTEHLPGLALAVIKDGKVVLQRTYGVVESGKNDKVNENTLFMIGSNSKAYTATALALLENEGKLSLDDKVTKWLPDWRLNDECATRMATVRDLLCHRIGMGTFQGDFTFWASSLTREEVMAKMAALVPSYEFRTRYGYCNSAFLTAGQIIPKTGGMAWEQFVRERIFKPLQMNRAMALSAELSSASNIARPHAYYDGRLQKLEIPNIDNLAPAGSISLSVSDMTHWLLMQLDTGRYAGKQVIPKNVILKTWDANTIVSPRNGYAYGLGWFISYPGGKKMLDHTGGVDGFLSASAFIPELKLGVIVLTNSDNNTLYASLRDQLLQEYRNEPFSNQIATATTSWIKGENEKTERIAQMRRDVENSKAAVALNWNAFTGVYTNPIYGDIEVVFEKNQLHVKLSLHPNAHAVLEHMGYNKFMCDFGNPTLGIHPMTFKIGDDGQAASLILKVNDFVEYGVYEFVRE